MVWDWTLRLLLPILVLLLAAVIYDIIRGSNVAMDGMERVAVALLAVTMLGIVGWWIASWIPSGDVGQQASQPRSRREERSPP